MHQTWCINNVSGFKQPYYALCEAALLKNRERGGDLKAKVRTMKFMKIEEQLNIKSIGQGKWRGLELCVHVVQMRQVSQRWLNKLYLGWSLHCAVCTRMQDLLRMIAGCDREPWPWPVVAPLSPTPTKRPLYCIFITFPN